MIIHADKVDVSKGEKARVEAFVVGKDLLAGEKLQWIVEGGNFNLSFLLPDNDESLFR